MADEVWRAPFWGVGQLGESGEQLGESGEASRPAALAQRPLRRSAPNCQLSKHRSRITSSSHASRCCSQSSSSRQAVLPPCTPLPCSRSSHRLAGKWCRRASSQGIQTGRRCQGGAAAASCLQAGHLRERAHGHFRNVWVWRWHLHGINMNQLLRVTRGCRDREAWNEHVSREYCAAFDSDEKCEIYI